MGPVETYRYLLEEIADPRVADWPLIKSPVPLLLIVIGYLLFVLHVGPVYMRDRKPFALNWLMYVYNIAVSIASGVLFYGLVKGYFTTLSLGCEPLKYSYDPESLRMAKCVYWVFILKVCELGDTIIFVLRKKNNQASFLHVYHHVTTLALSWFACKYAPGGMWTFNMIPNCAVHVVMYGYYFLASLGPKIQEKITPWKKIITRLQLIQFMTMLVHSTQLFLPSCEPTRRPLACMYMFQVVVIFYLFWDYYKKSYLRKKVQ